MNHSFRRWVGKDQGFGTLARLSFRIFNRQLIAQLTSRRGWPDSKGRLELESKQDMRSRNLPSPDRADAVLGAMTANQFGSGAEIVRARLRSHFNDGLHWQGRDAWRSL